MPREGNGSRFGCSPPQGNESELTGGGCEISGQILGVPSGDFPAWPDASLVCCGSDEVDGEVSDDGQVFGAVAFAQTRLVLGEDDVEDPMQTVLYAPVGTHGVGGRLRR